MASCDICLLNFEQSTTFRAAKFRKIKDTQLKAIEQKQNNPDL